MSMKIEHATPPMQKLSKVDREEIKSREPVQWTVLVIGQDVGRLTVMMMMALGRTPRLGRHERMEQQQQQQQQQGVI